MDVGGPDLSHIAKFVLKHRKLVAILFLIALLISVLMIPLVKINYNLADYVPAKADSTIAVEVMSSEFEQAIPNVQVYVPDLTLPEALALKEKIAASPSVTDVLWLDDVIDVYKPLNLADPSTVEGYYKNKGALFQVTVDDSDQPASLKLLQTIAGEEGAVSGQLVALAKAQMAVTSEITTIMIFAVPLTILILLLATHSWLEPLLLLISIIVSVVLNMGTNLIFGQISFITQSVAAVLQLAVSMDYAIFMLHRFNQYRKEGLGTATAMEKAMTKAFSAITSSALTTFFGFLALVFMRFKLGPDLGFVLAKGIIFSLISVILFLPVMTSYLYKWIDKTTHRPFTPSFAKFGRGIVKIHWGILLVVGILLLPSFLAQKENDFIYGMGAYESDSREERDRELIRREFGDNLQMAILVPNGDPVREQALLDALEAIPDVESVISLLSMTSAQIPVEILPASEIRQLRSENYSRMVVIAHSLPEGDHAFKLAEQLRATVGTIYPQDAHLAGENFSTLDMRDTIRTDEAIVNGLAILAVGLVLLFTFKSISLPLILLLTIEGSIWINLAIPYFSGTRLSYIGYLVISTVQLGATVDYGILYTQHYMDNRKIYPKKKAAAQSLAETLPSLLPPALILTVIGYILGLISSITIVSELGTVLGRGASLSFLMVATFLPALMILLDPLIKRTTLRASFFKSKLFTVPKLDDSDYISDNAEIETVSLAYPDEIRTVEKNSLQMFTDESPSKEAKNEIK